MYDLFFKCFREKVAISNEEEMQIRHYLMPKKLRKKQYLLQEGDPCKYIAFVEKGLLREYSVDESGNEHIFQFAPEGWTISDLFSFLTGEPATYNIDAIEDCELLLISKSAHEELLLQSPKYETYTRLQLTGAYLAMQKRITAIISLPANERYASLTALYPDLLQRVPQHMIASYMGLKPETLSRVRRKIAGS
ncbi:MAG: cyclic nucleotide-binding protein [Ferruginibacter sp.]|nr:cyclic nucleotide-binding protein [Ferruginibacter sp.]